MLTLSFDIAGAGHEASNALAAASNSRQLNHNEVIYLQDDQAESLFFVISGHVRLSYVMEDGSAILYAILPAGEPFGELGIFDGSVYCDMAMSIGNSVIGSVSAEENSTSCASVCPNSGDTLPSSSQSATGPISS